MRGGSGGGGARWTTAVLLLARAIEYAGCGRCCAVLCALCAVLCARWVVHYRALQAAAGETRPRRLPTRPTGTLTRSSCRRRLCCVWRCSTFSPSGLPLPLLCWAPPVLLSAVHQPPARRSSTRLAPSHSHSSPCAVPIRRTTPSNSQHHRFRHPVPPTPNSPLSLDAPPPSAIDSCHTLTTLAHPTQHHRHPIPYPTTPHHRPPTPNSTTPLSSHTQQYNTTIVPHPRPPRTRLARTSRLRRRALPEFTPHPPLVQLFSARLWYPVFHRSNQRHCSHRTCLLPLRPSSGCDWCCALFRVGATVCVNRFPQRGHHCTIPSCTAQSRHPRPTAAAKTLLTRRGLQHDDFAIFTRS